MENAGMEKQWVHCPVCNGKARIMINEDTMLYRFPLFCPHCKQETIISVGWFNVIVHTKTKGKAKSKVKAKV